MEREDANSSTAVSTWTFYGKPVEKNKLVYIVQTTLIYIVVLTCLVNISLHNGQSELWVALLSYSVGTILPSPKMKKNFISNNPSFNNDERDRMARLP